MLSLAHRKSDRSAVRGGRGNQHHQQLILYGDGVIARGPGLNLRRTGSGIVEDFTLAGFEPVKIASPGSKVPSPLPLAPTCPL